MSSSSSFTSTLMSFSKFQRKNFTFWKQGTQSKSPNQNLDLESDTIVELTSSVPGMWCYPTSQEHCCIYRVPESIRGVNPEAYTPQLVLIGPLHHHLKSQAFDITDRKSMGYLNMEEHKKIYLAEFAKRFEDINILDFFRATIKGEEEKIRASYSESTSWIKPLDFVEMILLDSVFILEFFHRGRSRANKTGDIVADETCLWYTVYDDLLLLENQLPFFILEKLFDPVLSHLTFRNLVNCMLGVEMTSDFKCEHFTDILRCARVKTLGSGKPTKSKFSYLASLFRCAHVETEGSRESTKKGFTDGSREPTKTKFNQFIEKIRWGQVKKTHSRQSTKRKGHTHMYNAEKLYSGGVEFEGVVFEGVKNEFLIDVRFENGCLKIPFLRVYDSTEMKLRNIMAFEQCHYPLESTHVCSFVLFLKNLIDSEKDVDLLIEKGILDNYIGEKMVVADMVNKLGWGIFRNDSSIYSDIALKVNAYYENPINATRAVLSRKYFSNVWTSTATVAATLLLVMTLIQTIASVIQAMQK